MAFKFYKIIKTILLTKTTIIMEQQEFLTEMDQNKLPSGLNTLTILTFVGSGFVILFSAITPWFLKLMKGFMDKAMTGEAAASLTPKQVEEMRKANDIYDLVLKNASITIPVTIVCAIASIVAAVMMRKRKKDGLTVYIAAEILPLIVSVILMGTAQFTGVMSYVLAIGLPLLFIVLYIMQKKHLTK
jgi:ABC-type spermidine/putrescine transport system permease subunit II